MRRIYLLVGAVVIATVAAVYFLAGREQAPPEVAMPQLSRAAILGQGAFGRYCAECHGKNGEGAPEKGPPLIHIYYEPGHHGDTAFVAAVRQGARGHHWSFGDMKPVEGVSDRELTQIILFVREVQRANGIM